MYTFNTSTSVASTFIVNDTDTADSFQTLINRSVKEKPTLKELDETDNNLTIKSAVEVDKHLDPDYFTTNFSDLSQATMLINSDEENERSQSAQHNSEPLPTTIPSSSDLEKIKSLIPKETKQYEKEHCLGLDLTRNEIEMRINLVNTVMQTELESLKLVFSKKRDLILKAMEFKKNSTQIF